MLNDCTDRLALLAERFEQTTPDELFRLRVAILSMPAELLDATPGWRALADSIERAMFPA
jgi:hypothetical protein